MAPQITKEQRQEVETLRNLYKSLGFTFRFENHKVVLSPDGTYIDFRITVKRITMEKGVKMYSYCNAFGGKWNAEEMWSFDNMIKRAKDFYNFLEKKLK